MRQDFLSLDFLFGLGAFCGIESGTLLVNTSLLSA